MTDLEFLETELARRGNVAVAETVLLRLLADLERRLWVLEQRVPGGLMRMGSWDGSGSDPLNK